MACGYRISVLHRLPKPDRRVRLPLTACFQDILKTFLEKTMNPFDMVKNLAGMQSQLKAAQEKLAELEAEGSSGGNMVQVTVNGKFELVDIKLDPICVDNRDVPMLQDLIKAAHHAALEKMQDEIKNQLGPMVAGMIIPGLGA